MSRPQNLTTSNSTLTTFTTLASNIIALASNPTTTTITNPDIFGNDPYFPADLSVTVLLTSSFPTSTSAATANSTTLFFAPAPPTTPLPWFEQAWIPLAVWLLFAYSLASAIVMVWIWCVESWSPHPTTNTSYEYRIGQSVMNARTVDEILELERFNHLSSWAERQQEEAVRRVRDQRRYVEISDAAARMGTF